MISNYFSYLLSYSRRNYFADIFVLVLVLEFHTIPITSNLCSYWMLFFLLWNNTLIVSRYTLAQFVFFFFFWRWFETESFLMLIEPLEMKVTRCPHNFPVFRCRIINKLTDTMYFVPSMSSTPSNIHDEQFSFRRSSVEIFPFVLSVLWRLMCTPGTSTKYFCLATSPMTRTKNKRI